jgi:hypothetical protein
MPTAMNATAMASAVGFPLAMYIPSTGATPKDATIPKLTPVRIRRGSRRLGAWISRRCCRINRYTSTASEQATTNEAIPAASNAAVAGVIEQ